GYDAAESLLLTARERVLRMGFQTGVEHAQHGGLLLEPARQLQRRRRMRVHAQLQRFEPLEEHPCIERAHAGTGGAYEAEYVGSHDTLIAHDGAADATPLAVEEL